MNPDNGQRLGIRTFSHMLLLPRLGVAGEQDAGRAVVRGMVTELSLVSEKSSPGGGAMTSVLRRATTTATLPLGESDPTSSLGGHGTRDVARNPRSYSGFQCD